MPAPRTLPDGGLVSLRWGNVGTALGRIWLLVPSIPMMPEGREGPSAAAVTPARP